MPAGLPHPIDFQTPESRYGKGPTLSRDEQALVLEKIIPPWLMAASKDKSNPRRREYQKAVVRLREMHAELKR